MQCKKYTNFKTTKKLTGKILGNSRTDIPLVVTYNPKIFFKSCNLCKSQNHFQNYEALFAIFQFMNSEKKNVKNLLKHSLTRKAKTCAEESSV